MALLNDNDSAAWTVNPFGACNTIGYINNHMLDSSDFAMDAHPMHPFPMVHQSMPMPHKEVINFNQNFTNNNTNRFTNNNTINETYEFPMNMGVQTHNNNNNHNASPISSSDDCGTNASNNNANATQINDNMYQQRISPHSLMSNTAESSVDSMNMNCNMSGIGSGNGLQLINPNIQSIPPLNRQPTFDAMDQTIQQNMALINEMSKLREMNHKLFEMKQNMIQQNMMRTQPQTHQRYHCNNANGNSNNNIMMPAIDNAMMKNVTNDQNDEMYPSMVFPLLPPVTAAATSTVPMMMTVSDDFYVSSDQQKIDRKSVVIEEEGDDDREYEEDFDVNDDMIDITKMEGSVSVSVSSSSTNQNVNQFETNQKEAVNSNNQKKSKKSPSRKRKLEHLMNINSECNTIDSENENENEYPEVGIRFTGIVSLSANLFGNGGESSYNFEIASELCNMTVKQINKYRWMVSSTNQKNVIYSLFLSEDLRKPKEFQSNRPKRGRPPTKKKKTTNQELLNSKEWNLNSENDVKIYRLNCQIVFSDDCNMNGGGGDGDCNMTGEMIERMKKDLSNLSSMNMLFSKVLSANCYFKSSSFDFYSLHAVDCDLLREYEIYENAENERKRKKRDRERNRRAKSKNNNKIKDNQSVTD